MPKYNTNIIKEMYTSYLLNNKNILFDKIGYHYFHNPAITVLDERDIDSIESISKEFKCKNDALSAANYFFEQFANPKRWSRVEKAKCNFDECVAGYMPTENNVEAIIDICGEINKKIIFSILENDSVIMRTFSPKNEQLGDNFRLEFITLADDSDFIYWTIIVD